MNLNWEQFLKAVERGKALLEELREDYPELKLKPVFSRFGPRSGQCDLTTDLRKIVFDFPDMLAGNVSHEKHENAQNVDAVFAGVMARTPRSLSLEGEIFSHEKAQEVTKKFRQLLMQLKQGEPVEKEANELEDRLLDPDLKLYFGDVLIEFRPSILKYESLRRLQQDTRLPQELNEVGNIRVVAGSLELLVETNTR
jgi:hypothetical protein